MMENIHVFQKPELKMTLRKILVLSLSTNSTKTKSSKTNRQLGDNAATVGKKFYYSTATAPLPSCRRAVAELSSTLECITEFLMFIKSNISYYMIK